jgi:hypothetical protein
MPDCRGIHSSKFLNEWETGFREIFRGNYRNLFIVLAIHLELIDI